MEYIKGRREAGISRRRWEEAITIVLEKIRLRLWTGFNGHKKLSSSGYERVQL
jgi:hypothetical protein